MATATFQAATERIHAHTTEYAARVRALRQQDDAMMSDAVVLGRPFELLKRRRIESEAAELALRAERIEARLARVDARVDEYAGAYAAITSTSARRPADAAAAVVAPEDAAAVDAAAAAERPPGATLAARNGAGAGPLGRGSLNLRAWLEQRDVTQLKEALVAEMIQDLLGIVPKGKAQNTSRCADCSRDLVLRTDKAMLVCPACGAAQPHLDATPSCVAFDESGRREMYSNFSYTYKRLNHLFERIQQLTADSAVEVTDELLRDISTELHHRRVTVAGITAPLIKDILKKLKRRECYEHVVLITCRLQGSAPPVFTRATLEKLRRMFEAVQRPFERACPVNRSNFLSYIYTLYKFLQLLGAYELLPYFTLLKGKAKLAKQDAIWSAICAELGWQFIPSV